MDPKDWRTNLNPEVRERFINMTIDHIERSVPFANEVKIKQCAVISEEKIFSTAMSLQDYILKSFTRMENIENRIQENLSGAASINSILSTPTKLLGIVDVHEEASKKFKSMKEMYLPTLIQIHMEMTTMPERLLVKVNMYRIYLKLLIIFLRVSENNILPDLKNLDILKKGIINFLDVYQLRIRPNPSQRQGQQNLQPQTQMQPTSVTSFRHGSRTSLSIHLGTPAVKPNIINTMPDIIPPQPNSNVCHPDLKQQREQKLLQEQQQKQQIHQINEANDLKARQGIDFKSGKFPQHHSAGQPSAHHSSPQTDQQVMLTSPSKAGTPLQSPNSTSSPISPSTPLAPSPIPGNPEKHISHVSKNSSAGNIGQTEGTISLSQTQSLVIYTPGTIAATIISAKPSETEQAEQPRELPIDVVKSMSAKSFAITTVDRIGGSTPGNGSRTAVDGDLEATEKFHFDLNEIPMDDVSSDDSMTNRFKCSASLEIIELESTESSSRIKKPRI